MTVLHRSHFRGLIGLVFWWFRQGLYVLARLVSLSSMVGDKTLLFISSSSVCGRVRKAAPTARAIMGDRLRGIERRAIKMDVLIVWRRGKSRKISIFCNEVLISSKLLEP